MPRKRDTTINESLEELQMLEKRYRGKPEAVRIAVLRLMKEDQKRGIEDVALLAGVSTPTVKRWWRAYREGGIELMLKPIGRVQRELRIDQLDLIKRKLVAGDFKTIEELELWIAASKAEQATVTPMAGRRDPPENGGRVAGRGIHTPLGTQVLTADDFFRFLSALPITHTAQEWSESFRLALQSLLRDVDRVSISMNLQCNLTKPEGYRPWIFVSQEVASGRNLVNGVRQPSSEESSEEHSEQGSREHLTRFLDNLHRTNFPFEEYQEPHSFVYYFRKQAYLGVILIWRQRDRAPLSALTIQSMERMQNFIELLLSDFVARHQASRPIEQAFSKSIEDLISRTGLTGQERRILVLQLMGCSYEEVADTLNISLNTVRFHLRSVYAKTGTHSQAELVAKYFTPRMDPSSSSK
jgi:DNA-binding CsgD family transcriptional regulator